MTDTAAVPLRSVLRSVLRTGSVVYRSAVVIQGGSQAVYRFRPRRRPAAGKSAGKPEVKPRKKKR